MQILELAQYLLTLSHWSVVPNKSSHLSAHLPSELHPVAASLGSVIRGGEVSPRVVRLGGGRGGGGGGSCGLVQVETSEVAEEVEAGRGGGRGAYHRGQRGQGVHRGGQGRQTGSAGNLGQICINYKFQILKNHKTVLLLCFIFLLTTLVVLLLVAEGGGLMAPAGGGGSIPRPPAGRPLAGRALSLLGMFIFTFIV